MLELVLLIVSITLLYILLPIIAIFVLIKRLITGDWKLATTWFYATAREIDVFGNFVGAPLFNSALIITGGYKFGCRGETMSSVLGKNYRDRTLSRAGKCLRWCLDNIETDHVKLSILDKFTNTRK